MHAEEGKYLGAQKSKEGIIIFHGGVKLRIDNYNIYADTVKINPDTGEILGEGNLTITDGIQVLKGSKFYYDNSIHSGVLFAIQGMLNQPDAGKTAGIKSENNPEIRPIYVMGENLKIISKDTFIISIAFLSSCEAESPHYFIKASKIWIQPDNRLVIVGAVYYVGGLPLFYFPFFFETDFGTGIRTVFGTDVTRGVYLQNSFFYGFPRGTILPENSVFMFDFYQYDGFYLGTYLKKRTPGLNYDITLGVASQMGKIVTTTATGQIITNTLFNPDGSIQRLPFDYELNAQIQKSWNLDFDKDTKSQVKITFEQYRNNNFDLIFKQRFVPLTTGDALSINKPPVSSFAALRNSLTWEAVYSENWQNNSLVIKLGKYWTWNKITDINPNIYNYYPTLDYFPSLTFHKQFYIVHPAGGWFQGISSETSLSTGIRHEYNNTSQDKINADVLHTVNYLDLISGLQALFPLHNMFYFRPSAGYGITGQSYNNETASDTIENGIKSYQYLYSVDDLFFGPSFFRGNIKYSYRYAVVQKLPDPYFGSVRDNRMLFYLSSDFAPYGFFSLGTARDMRTYPGVSSETDHWDPVAAAVNFDYDFVNKDNIFLPDIYRLDKFFIGAGGGDTFSYNIRYNNPGQNNVNVYLQTGGYRFLFFEKIQKIKTGVSWTHDFLNFNNNNFKMYIETKINLFKYWQVDFSISGIAYHLGTQNQPYSNLSSILNLSKTPLYLNDMSIAVEHDLHDWVIQLSYSLRQTWIPFYVVSPNYTNYAGFYESQIYLTFNLKGLQGKGLSQKISDTNNPIENPKAYGLN